MEQIRLNNECKKCLIKKYSKDFPEGADKKSCQVFSDGVLEIINSASQNTSAPELVEQFEILRKKCFGITKDFTQIKNHFNKLILSMENEIENKIANSNNPLETAVKYAMMGNYIDFGAMKNVDEDKLLKLIEDATDIDIPQNEFERFNNELKTVHKIVYLTDNCGEVVFDKILIKNILKLFPNIEADIIVRGEAVLNDATEDDAKQVGLYDIANVIGNGTAIAGTCLKRISDDAKNKLHNADLIIAKGQGNFETLHHCGLNIYYIFMCKCTMFADRFKVPRFSGMFINDLRLE